MFRHALLADSLVARTRPAWGWLGQVMLAWLGVHLAADRLDDLVGGWLAASGIAWPEPEQPLIAGTWAAVALELLVAAWLVWARFRVEGEVASARLWWQRLCVNALLVPAAFLVFGLAGSWVMAMAAEDLLAPVWPAVAEPTGWVVGVLVAVRLAVPATIRTVVGAPIPKRPWDGVAALLPVGLLLGLAARHGLPIWGWWP